MNPIAAPYQSLLSISLASTLLDNALTEMALHVKSLDSSLQQLNNSIQRITISGNFYNSSIQLPENRYAQPAVVTAQNDHLLPKPEEVHSSAFNTLKEYTKIGSAAGKLAENGIKLSESFAALSPTMLKVQKGLGVFNKTLEVVGGAETLAGSMGIAEGLEVIAAGLTGIEGLAGIAAVTGPIGWAIGAGVAGVGILGYMAYQHYNNGTPVNNVPTIEQSGIQNENPFFLQRQIEDSKRDSIIEIANQKTPAEIALEVNNLKNKYLQDGGNIDFDIEEFTGKDPVHMEALLEALKQNSTMKRPSISSVVFQTEEQRQEFSNKYDPMHLFPLSVTSNFVLPANITPKQYDVSEDAQTTKMGNYSFIDFLTEQKNAQMQSDIVTSISLYGLDYTMQGLNSRQKKPDYLQSYADIDRGKDFALKTQNVIDQDRQSYQFNGNRFPQEQGIQRTYNPAGNTGNQVIINLNKAMIEQFTINVKDTKESIDELKQKVEKALIEILKSANATN